MAKMKAINPQGHGDARAAEGQPAADAAGDDAHLPRGEGQPAGRLPADRRRRSRSSSRCTGCCCRASRCAARPGSAGSHDLSAHDPYFILPVLMTVTSLLQTCAEPGAAGPDAGQDDVDHAAGLLGDVLLLPGRPGAVLDHQQHAVDRPAVADQQAHGRAAAVQPAEVQAAAGSQARSGRNARAAKAALVACASTISSHARPPPRSDRRHRDGPRARRGGHRARLGPRRSRRSIEAVCGRALEAARRRPTSRSALPTAAPSTRAWRSTFPAPHSYTGEDVLELQAHGGPVVLQLLLARCLRGGRRADPRRAPRLPGLRLAAAGRIHRAGVPQRQARPGAGRGHRRPDRRQHRSGRAQRQPFARPASSRGEIARACATRWCTCACWSRRRWTSPRRRSTSSQQADAAGPARARCAQTLDAGAAAGAPGRAAARGHPAWCIAGQPNAARARCSMRWPAPSWRSSRRCPAPRATRSAQTIQIEGVPLHVVDTAGLRESERRGRADRHRARLGPDRERRRGAVPARPDARSATADYQAGDARSSRELPAAAVAAARARRLEQARRCAAARHRAARGRRSIALSAKTGAGLDALRRACSHVAGWQAAPEGVFIARARHVQALRARRGAPGKLRRRTSSPATPALELLAEELRLAQMRSARSPAQFSADDLLGAIFARFCIGK